MNVDMDMDVNIVIDIVIITVMVKDIPVLAKTPFSKIQLSDFGYR